MEQNEKPAVIKYLNLKGLTPNEISNDMKVVLGDDVPSCATIYRWIAEFQRGRESTEDVHRSGRPVDKISSRIFVTLRYSIRVER